MISKQNSQNIIRKYRATRNFLQIHFLTALHYANKVKANQHNEIQTSWFAVHRQKTIYFLVFHRNIGLKTSKHEFTDISHPNKQGFEGKKLSGEEFLAFEEYQRVCVEDMAGSASCTQGKDSPYCFLTSIFSSYPPESFKKIIFFTCIWSKFVYTSFHSLQTLQQNPCRISQFKRSWREADNPPGAGTSQIYLCALYYYMRNFCNLIGLEQWYFSLI